MVEIVVHYRDNATDPLRLKAAYTKIRGSFFCIHLPAPKGGPFKNKLIPADLINFVEQTSDKDSDSSESDDLRKSRKYQRD